jgi:hypothetical protein
MAPSNKWMFHVDANRPCRHCPMMQDNHHYVCNCTHHHAEHEFAGGCKAPNCLCSHYDQSRQYRPGHTLRDSEKTQELEITNV